MAEFPPDNPNDEPLGPNLPEDADDGEATDHYELADHPDEMDDGPPPAVPSAPKRPTPKPAPADTSSVPAEADVATDAPSEIDRCPHCDKKITGSMLAGNCPHCGKRIDTPASPDQQSTKHATTALALGVLSMPLGLCCLSVLGTIYGSALGAILGALAVHFAGKAHQDIAEGHAPPTSEGTANLGRVFGIIGVVIGCALTLIYAGTQLIAFALDF